MLIQELKLAAREPGLGRHRRPGYEEIRMLLTVLIRLYRIVPWRPRCPRSGPSCSELGLAIARSGGTVGDVLRLVASCQGDGAPGPACDDTGACCGTGCHTTSAWLRPFS